MLKLYLIVIFCLSYVFLAIYIYIQTNRQAPLELRVPQGANSSAIQSIRQSPSRASSKVNDIQTNRQTPIELRVPPGVNASAIQTKRQVPQELSVQSGVNVVDTQTKRQVPQENVELIVSSSKASVNDVIICNDTIKHLYQQLPNLANVQLSFCKDAITSYSVDIGRSWGRLPSDLQLKWTHYNCDLLIKAGRPLPCNEIFGWPFLTSWVNDMKTYISNSKSPKSSQVSCGLNNKNSLFCKMTNVRIDFSKSQINGDSRSFRSGFFQTYGTQDVSTIGNDKVLKLIESLAPGTVHIDSSRNNLKWMENEECDVIETSPTFLTSNDDIFNLAHYMNDVMDMWTMIFLSKRNSKHCNLLNFDGFRAWGPGSTTRHRLMLSDDPDNHGYFIAYYKSWFKNIYKAKDYGNKRVCYKELYLPIDPGLSLYWSPFGNKPPFECALQAPSPIFQSFNHFLRNRWKESLGMGSLKSPPSETITIVIELRPFYQNKGKSSSVRVIGNVKDVVKKLQSLDNVKVITQTFSEIPFEQQVALVHSANIYISMHGAGTVHVTNMAIGSPNCCALIELQPHPSHGVVVGNENFGRLLGVSYFKFVADEKDTTESSTNIDPVKLHEIVINAIDAIRTKPTCLHDIRDMTKQF